MLLALALIGRHWPHVCPVPASWWLGMWVGRGPNVSVAVCSVSNMSRHLCWARALSWERHVQVGIDMFTLGSMWPNWVWGAPALCCAQVHKLAVIRPSMLLMLVGKVDKWLPHVPRRSPTPWVSPRIFPPTHTPSQNPLMSYRAAYIPHWRGEARW